MMSTDQRLPETVVRRHSRQRRVAAEQALGLVFYTDDFMADVMGINSLPDVLYHYTSIETFALILASQSLRFQKEGSVQVPQ